MEIEYPRIDEFDLNLWQGDIILRNDEIKENPPIGTKAIGIDYQYCTKLWPNATVYYKFFKDNGTFGEAELTEKGKIYFREAIDHFHDNTHIRFIEGDDPKGIISPLIIKTKNTSILDGATLGYGDNNVLYLTLHNYIPLEAKFRYIHLLGHILGLENESSRPDRDQYITIHYQNMDPACGGGNFAINNSYLLKEYTSFDFNSIMMLHPYIYTVHGSATITLKNGKPYNPPSGYLSNNDVATLKKMYSSALNCNIVSFKIYLNENDIPDKALTSDQIDPGYRDIYIKTSKGNIYSYKLQTNQNKMHLFCSEDFPIFIQNTYPYTGGRRSKSYTNTFTKPRNIDYNCAHEFDNSIEERENNQGTGGRRDGGNRRP